MDYIDDDYQTFMNDGSLNLNMIYADSQGLKRADGTIIKDFQYKDLFDEKGKIKINILVYDELCRRYDAYATNALEERYIFEYEKESIFLGSPHRSRGIEDDEDEFDEYVEEEYMDYREDESEEENYEDYDEPEDDDSLLDDLLLLAVLEDDGSLDDF